MPVDDIHVLIDALGVGDFPEREAAIKALVASKDQHVSQILQQLSDGLLYVNSDGGPVLLGAVPMTNRLIPIRSPAKPLPMSIRI